MRKNKKGLSKTAILLLTIGNDAARQVLARLSSKEVEVIAEEISDCGEILTSEKEQILKEFYGDFISKEEIMHKEKMDKAGKISSPGKVNKKL